MLRGGQGERKWGRRGGRGGKQARTSTRPRGDINRKDAWMKWNRHAHTRPRPRRVAHINTRRHLLKQGERGALHRSTEDWHVRRDGQCRVCVWGGERKARRREQRRGRSGGRRERWAASGDDALRSGSWGRAAQGGGTAQTRTRGHRECKQRGSQHTPTQPVEHTEVSAHLHTRAGSGADVCEGKKRTAKVTRNATSEGPHQLPSYTHAHTLGRALLLSSPLRHRVSLRVGFRVMTWTPIRPTMEV